MIKWWDDLSQFARSLIQDKKLESGRSGEEKTYKYEKNAKMIKTVLQNEDDALASVLQLKHFRDCVVNNVQPLINIDESITVIKMIEAIYESSKNKKEIKI